MSEEPRRAAPQFGDPVELPWWVIPLGLPPALTAVLAVVIGAPAVARLVAIVVSLLMLAVLSLVARRVASRNMQSVWISAAYAVWAFGVVIWAVAAVSGSHAA